MATRSAVTRRRNTRRDRITSWCACASPAVFFGSLVYTVAVLLSAGAIGGPVLALFGGVSYFVGFAMGIVGLRAPRSYGLLATAGVLFNGVLSAVATFAWVVLLVGI